MGSAAHNQSGRVQRCQWAGLSGALSLSLHLAVVCPIGGVAVWLRPLCPADGPLSDLDQSATGSDRSAVPLSSSPSSSAITPTDRNATRFSRRLVIINAGCTRSPACVNKRHDDQCESSEGAEPDFDVAAPICQPASRPSMRRNTARPTLTCTRTSPCNGQRASIFDSLSSCRQELN